MHSKTHATLARLLIKACGGLERAADNCRLGKSRLQEIQDPDNESFMPADVMADLEAYAGEPLYSAAIAKARPAAPMPKGLMEEGMETAEAGVEVMRLLRVALEDGELTASERLQVEAQLVVLEAQVSDVREAMNRRSRAAPRETGGGEGEGEGGA
ncbi:hypothetical protein [Phenylobacterium sp.]|uniref:hypothetical protein n=1 Tax=Phenylobacterium sp. TaxID=1871053 RepID=UPI00301D4D4C